MTSIQERHVELVLTVFNDGVVGSELVLRAFRADSEDERGLIL